MRHRCNADKSASACAPMRDNSEGAVAHAELHVLAITLAITSLAA